jgi:hypothetical protein
VCVFTWHPVLVWVGFQFSTSSWPHGLEVIRPILDFVLGGLVTDGLDNIFEG